MKQLAGSIRIGWVIEYKGKPWTITKAMHIKPGKGGAFMQVEMKAVEEGTKTNERFRTEDTVEKLMVEEKDCQFLFEDGTGLLWTARLLTSSPCLPISSATAVLS